MVILAPFSPKQVKRINAYQHSGAFHELTCPTPHKNRTLVARTQGLYCPSCNYLQDWVPEFVDNDRWLKRVNPEGLDGDAAQ